MATTIAQIGGFELWDILQLAQTSRMSIKLSVESPHGTGAMYFQGGSLLHAEAGDTKGDEAVNIILDWREGSVSSSQLPENCPQTVRHSSIVALLMDRARQRDEQSRTGAPPPAPVQVKPATPVTPPPIPTTAAPPGFPAAPMIAPTPTAREQLTEAEARGMRGLLEELDDVLMGGLLSADLISKGSGASLAGVNSAPKTSVLFTRLAEQLQQALSRSEEGLIKGVSKLIIEGDNGLFVFVFDLDDRHRMAILVDGAKVPLGIVFAIIPDFQPRLAQLLQRSRH